MNDNELKREIINFLIDNIKESQLLNACMNNFYQYIFFIDNGEFCIGGREVYDFMVKAENLIKYNQ